MERSGLDCSGVLGRGGASTVEAELGEGVAGTD